MPIGLIIIGDEILSGKRADKHFPKVLEILKARGLQLDWAEYLGDDPARVTATLKRTMAGKDIVFCTGGIGATPDDHTRQCAAAAMGVPVVLHPEAKEKILERMADTARETGKPFDPTSPEQLQRLKMGEFPQGAHIIPNPYNKIPGFYVTHGEGVAHYFTPGFPVMAWPMIEWALDTFHRDLFGKVAWAEKSVLVYEMAESTLTPMMESLEAEFDQVKVFSLPSVGEDGSRRHIELGLKGEPEQVEKAFAKMLAELDRFKAEYKNV